MAYATALVLFFSLAGASVIPAVPAEANTPVRSAGVSVLTKSGGRVATQIRYWSTKTKVVKSGRVIRDRVRIRSGSAYVKRRVVLSMKQRGTRWRDADSRKLKTTKRGRLKVSFRPPRPGDWVVRLKVPGTSTYRSGRTANRKISVVRQSVEQPNLPTPSPSPRPPGSGVPDVCAASWNHIADNRVTDPRLNEISGLTASVTHQGVLWVHNDSGDAPSLYAINTSGTLVRTVLLRSATARDWEDIARGPGPVPGVTYLYAADIGDNRQERASIVIYRVPEPDPHSADGSVSEYDVLSLTYPDGPHNAETLLVDPLRGDLVIVTKTSGRSARLYSVSALPAGDHTAVLDTRGDLDAGGIATGGDVNADGRTVAIRTYSGVRGWDRDPSEPLWSALAEDGCQLTSAVEAQGEALGFSGDGLGYVTISEGSRPHINRFQLID